MFDQETHQDLTSLPGERLESEITELAAHLWAATCRWLLLVAEFERRENWRDWGCKSCAHWLNWRCGVSLTAAREQVRVARHLAELPKITEALSRGELSYSKVRALSWVARSETEHELLELARHATGSHLDRIVRGYRTAVRNCLEQVNERHAERYVHWHYADDGSLVLKARLDPEQGCGRGGGDRDGGQGLGSARRRHRRSRGSVQCGRCRPTAVVDGGAPRGAAPG